MEVDNNDKERVKNYVAESLIISILSCLCICSLPISLLSVYYSTKVDSLIARNEYKLATRYSRIAFVLVATSACITFGLYLLILIILIRLSGPY